MTAWTETSATPRPSQQPRLIFLFQLRNSSGAVAGGRVCSSQPPEALGGDPGRLAQSVILAHGRAALSGTPGEEKSSARPCDGAGGCDNVPGPPIPAMGHAFQADVRTSGPTLSHHIFLADGDRRGQLGVPKLGEPCVPFLQGPRGAGAADGLECTQLRREQPRVLADVKPLRRGNGVGPGREGDCSALGHGR